jgi:hypothetical protein
MGRGAGDAWRADLGSFGADSRGAAGGDLGSFGAEVSGRDRIGFVWYFCPREVAHAEIVERRRGAELAAWARWTADWAMETEFGEFGIWLSYPLQDYMGERRVRNRMAASDGK